MENIGDGIRETGWKLLWERMKETPVWLPGSTNDCTARRKVYCSRSGPQEMEIKRFMEHYPWWCADDGNCGRKMKKHLQTVMFAGVFSWLGWCETHYGRMSCTRNVFLQFVTDEWWRCPHRKRCRFLWWGDGKQVIVILPEGQVKEKNTVFLYSMIDCMYWQYFVKGEYMNGIVSEIMDTLAFVCSVCVVIVCCHFPIG